MEGGSPVPTIAPPQLFQSRGRPAARSAFPFSAVDAGRSPRAPRRAVDAATIRDFRGATQGLADRGLLITTSHFTRDAEREATRAGVPPIDLIGGQLLVGLLRKLKLGVRTAMVERVTVEGDWFKAL